MIGSSGDTDPIASNVNDDFNLIGQRALKRHLKVEEELDEDDPDDFVDEASSSHRTIKLTNFGRTIIQSQTSVANSVANSHNSPVPTVSFNASSSTSSSSSSGSSSSGSSSGSSSSDSASVVPNSEEANVRYG